ncbi:MAG: carbohydrate ABC transporter permease [Firmicutes bacterium]|nr:carbohydrate ABC transporter permease [Bacillota bacterium]
MPRKLLRDVALYLVYTILTLVMVFPFVWMASSAIKTPDLIFRYPPIIIPPNPTFENIRQVFVLAPFARYMFNSFFVSATVTIVALLFHSMAGYSLARLSYPGREYIFTGILSTLMIPFYAIMIPLFILIRNLGWLDTYYALIIPAIPHAFGIFMLRQFFLGLPRELEEAAVMDGCSLVGVYAKVAVPLAKPVMSALAIFFFIANWDSFLWPLIVTNSPQMRVVQIGIVQFIGEHGRSWNLVMAAATVAVIPSIILFFTLQRHLVQGIKLTGLKS